MNILDYIKGPKRGKPAHEFEEKLMRDPFLAEAMEGYKKVKGNHDLIIARLQKQIAKKAKRRRFRQPMFIWSSIASAVAVVAFIAFFFLGGFHLHFRGHKQLAASDKPAQHSNVAADTTATTSVTLGKDSVSDIPQSKNTEGTPDRKLIVQAPPKQRSAARKSPVNRNNNGEKEFSPTAEDKPRTNSATPPELAFVRTDNADTFDVVGIVKDTKGNALAGVKISADNGPGIFTDSSGKFTLRHVLKGQSISFSYIGFKTEGIVVSEKTSLPVNVMLSENNDLLSEQVIISKDEWTNSTSKKTEKKSSPAIGFQAYLNYLQKNKVKTTSGDCGNKKGKVKVAFSTDEKGRPYNIRVLQKLCPEYDGQAIRLINNGPAWTPACENVEYEVGF